MRFVPHAHTHIQSCEARVRFFFLICFNKLGIYGLKKKKWFEDLYKVRMTLYYVRAPSI